MNFTLYKQELYDKIIAFNKKAFPLRKGVEDSFLARFFNNPVRNYLDKSAFIYDENSQEILGQYLIMGTEFHYQNKSYEGIWGVDFILDEKLRGQKKGKLLAEAAITVPNYCAIGPSKISEALHYKFGNKKLGDAFRYIRFLNIFSPLHLIFKKNNFHRYNVQYPEFLNVKNLKIQRITEPENLPDKKFWNPENLEWDRSQKFLKWRFFEKPNKYAFYLAENREFYLVVRKVRWRNLNVLLLVDYRYKNGSNDFQKIYKSTLKIAKKTNCSAVISLTCIEEEQNFLKKNFNIKFGESLLVMTTCDEVAHAKTTAITFADSDADTFYGDNVW